MCLFHLKSRLFQVYVFDFAFQDASAFLQIIYLFVEVSDFTRIFFFQFFQFFESDYYIHSGVFLLFARWDRIVL